MDGILYLLEHIALAASRPGYALLGQQPGAWFRPRDVEAAIGLDRSTIRKHYADPMSTFGLLERREARGTPRPTFEYAVTVAGNVLRRHIEAVLGVSPAASDTAASTTIVVVAADDAVIAEDLAAELQHRLSADRVQHAIALSARDL